MSPTPNRGRIHPTPRGSKALLATSPLLCVILAMALTAWMELSFSGCGGDESSDGPVQTLEAFMQAVETGDTKKAWKLLGPATKNRLKGWAQEANAGEGVDLKPQDLLSPATRLASGAEWTPQKFKVVEESKGVAMVEVSSPAPAHTIAHSDGVSVGWVAGSHTSLHFSRPPEWTARRQLPILGTSVVVALEKKGAEPTLKAGRQARVKLVRQGDQWRVELDVKVKSAGVDPR